MSRKIYQMYLHSLLLLDRFNRLVDYLPEKTRRFHEQMQNYYECLRHRLSVIRSPWLGLYGLSCSSSFWVKAFSSMNPLPSIKLLKKGFGGQSLNQSQRPG